MNINIIVFVLYRDRIFAAVNCSCHFIMSTEMFKASVLRVITFFIKLQI